MSYIAGLSGIRYNGYFDDNANWFKTATPHGDTNNLISIDNFSSDNEYYSWEWMGYFRANSSETYTFYTNSDDASYLWLGNNAINNYTIGNALVNNGGLHGTQESSGISPVLVSGQYYPIRIQFGENTGGDVVTVSFSTDTIPKTTDGSGYYFYKNISLNSLNLPAVYLGYNSINRIYLGDKIVFGNFTPTPTPTPTITPTPMPFVLWSFENAPYICNMDIDITTNKLYINNCGTSGGETNNVIVFDLNSKSIVNNLIVGRAPQHINIGGTKAIVSNVYYEDQTSSLIDLLTYNITTINRVNQVGLGLPGPSIIDTTNNKLFISEFDGLVVRNLTDLSVITTINNNSEININSIEYIDININTNKLYCSKVYNNKLTIVNTINNTIITTITFDANDNICGIACNKTTNKTYVSIVNGDQTELRVIEISDNNSVSQSITISNTSNLTPYYQSITCDESNNIVYVIRNNIITMTEKFLYQIDPLVGSIVSSTKLAGNASSLTYNPNNNKIYAIVNTTSTSQLQEISIN